MSMFVRILQLSPYFMGKQRHLSAFKELSWSFSEPHKSTFWGSWAADTATAVARGRRLVALRSHITPNLRCCWADLCIVPWKRHESGLMLFYTRRTRMTDRGEDTKIHSDLKRSPLSDRRSRDTQCSFSVMWVPVNTTRVTNNSACRRWL
jgi:hypothetical protein